MQHIWDIGYESSDWKEDRDEDEILEDEDELLEDLATYSEELIIKETKQIDESVVSLANDLIDNIEKQEFDDDDEFM